LLLTVTRQIGHLPGKIGRQVGQSTKSADDDGKKIYIQFEY
jgi:hypothetical protein